jgi:hypothetical protein
MPAIPARMIAAVPVKSAIRVVRITVSVVVGIMVPTKNQPDYKPTTYRGIIRDVDFCSSVPP